MIIFNEWFLLPDAIFILNLVLRLYLLKILFNNLGQQTSHDNPVSKTFLGLDSNRKNEFWLFIIRAEIARLSVPDSLHKEEETGTIFFTCFFRLQVGRSFLAFVSGCCVFFESRIFDHNTFVLIKSQTLFVR